MDLDRQAPRITAICLTVLTAFAVAGALYLLRGVMVPFVLAAFLAVALEPIVDGMVHRARLPRWLAVIATVLVGLVILGLFSVLIVSAASLMTDSLPVYREQLVSIYTEHVQPVLQKLHLSAASDGEVAIGSERISRLAQQVLGGITNAGLSVASDAAMVLIFLVFMLLEPTRPDERSEASQAIRASIRQYVLIKTAISVVTGLLVGVTLALLGVELALVIGILAFALNYIATIGPWIATLLPIPIILGAPDLGPTASAAAVLIPGTIQIVSGNVVEPRVFGQSLDLNPVVVMVGLLFWGTLWGMTGVFLAVPLTAALKIILERIGFTQPVADLLSDRGRRQTDASSRGTGRPKES